MHELLLGISVTKYNQIIGMAVMKNDELKHKDI
jgi:hypothetical protein